MSATFLKKQPAGSHLINHPLLAPSRPLWYLSSPMRPEASQSPSVLVQVECPAGKLLRGNLSLTRDPQVLECQAGREYCQVACVVNAVIFKSRYNPGEKIGSGIVGGYCILQDAGFARRHAIFTVPPPSELIDPTLPF